jgi:superfamily II RNA helicase
MIYDPFQKKAINYLKEGHSVIVSAPTGAGKTIIAEQVISDCLAKDKGVIYTAPIKALSNQKFRDFQERYGDKIGILTGDVSINTSAPVLIMTTEILRNKILEKSCDLRRFSWIIFDEVHYLDDYERGSVWEESLIFLPAHMSLLALSATIPNVDQLKKWIESIHEISLKVVKETQRPVPLHFFYQCQGKILDDLGEVEKLGYKSRRAYSHYKNRPTSIIRHIRENNRLPCIYFVFGRRRAEYLAQELESFNFLTLDERDRIKNMFFRLCEKFNLRGEKSAAMLLPLVEKGIAYHHAGMFPTLKEVVERLFTSRLIKVIFTTETFALGINMPARTVIFDRLRKFYGRYRKNLKTRDFYQMAGRAGRRGIDREGFVYSTVNPHFVSFSELNRIIYGRPEEVRSQFNTSYATILNLYINYGEKLLEVYPLSFHYSQTRPFIRKMARELLYSKLKILKELGYIKRNKLTDKGIFASKIYGYELSLSELYEKGVLLGLSEIEMAILCVALVFEPRRETKKPRLSKKAKFLQAMTEKIVSRIQRMERKFKIRPLTKGYFYHLSPCIEAWMRKEGFEKLFFYTDVDEGEIIRYFRMAVQILRELLETPLPDLLKKKLNKTINLVSRDVIDAEKQLRL